MAYQLTLVLPTALASLALGGLSLLGCGFTILPRSTSSPLVLRPISLALARDGGSDCITVCTYCSSKRIIPPDLRSQIMLDMF
ncbi:hypothetical protein CRG98_013527 [Punica granatum]|uniref:Uncharacterized protein n=1 Tax=Punica granatum TaxID=22663 RepID=A0A2I0KC13_PUNGR|nr:hypothetical protein CRG98_013527 [Punica granatum]